jgi:hypothetical protein
LVFLNMDFDLSYPFAMTEFLTCYCFFKVEKTVGNFQWVLLA